MTTVTKEIFLQQIEDPERIIVVKTEDDEVRLREWISYSDNEYMDRGCWRFEDMDFKLEKNEYIVESALEAPARNSGGMTSDLHWCCDIDDIEAVLTHWLEALKPDRYLICSRSDIVDELRCYQNERIVIYFED